MKVRYIGSYYAFDFDKTKTYDVMSIEKGWYRIMTEDGDYLYPPKSFEIVERLPEPPVITVFEKAP